MACGLAYNIDAGTNEIWGESADSLNVMNIQTDYRTRIGKGTCCIRKRGSFKKLIDLGLAEGQLATAADIAALRYETDKRIEAIKNTDNLTPSTGTLKRAVTNFCDSP